MINTHEKHETHENRMMAGLTLVKEEKDVDKLDGDDATLMSELQRPQVGLFISIGIGTHH